MSRTRNYKIKENNGGADGGFRRWLAVGLLCLLVLLVPAAGRTSSGSVSADGKVDVKGIVFGHLGDSYEWHITDIGDYSLCLHLPVIVRSDSTGWHCFLSSRFAENGGTYRGFFIAPAGTPYEGKVVERNAAGELVRPLDISLTKVALSLLINSAIVVTLVLWTARWYRRRKPDSPAPRGLVGSMEILVNMLEEDVARPCIGANYRRFSPYLMTAFFFILVNNLMGLVPLFPGGANVTGNIAVTMVLALFTFLMVNLFGTKHYWKDVFWPDVPVWLKVPFPLMPLIELIGLFTKPFALMIRLFANMLAGHMAMLVLVSMIFVSVSMGPVLNGGLTLAAVLFNIFMNALELLVAFIQAYIFTMLSAVYIGLAQAGGESEKK